MISWQWGWKPSILSWSLLGCRAAWVSLVFLTLAIKAFSSTNSGLMLVLGLGVFTQAPWLPLLLESFCSCFAFFLESLLSRNSEPSHFKEVNLSCHFQDSRRLRLQPFLSHYLHPRSLLKQERVPKGPSNFLQIDHLLRSPSNGGCLSPLSSGQDCHCQDSQSQEEGVWLASGQIGDSTGTHRGSFEELCVRKSRAVHSVAHPPTPTTFSSILGTWMDQY